MNNDKLIEEAAELGLEFLRRINGGKSYEYRFLKCGHIQIMQHGNVLRNDKVTCYTCAENELQEFADSVGFELQPKTGDSIKAKRTFKYKDCGHFLVTNYSRLKISVPVCKKCTENKHEEEANTCGMTIIARTVAGKAGYKRYLVKACGHELELSPSAVRIGEVSCKVCYNEQLNKEAEYRGLTLLGDCLSGAKTKRLYRINSCGHIRSIQTYQVRIGSILCDICDKYYWNKPSYLYVLKISTSSFSWLKIGFSNKVDFRVKRYGLDETAEVNLLFIHKFDSGKIVNTYESNLHRKLSSFKLNPHFMRQYHTKSGFTECYSCNEHTAIALAKEVCSNTLTVN